MQLIPLGKLPTLRVLILRRLYRVDESVSDFVRNILIRCPHVSHVYIEVEKAVYERFTHASLASTPMRSVTVARSAVDNPHPDPPCGPHADSYARAFASISAFDGI